LRTHYHGRKITPGYHCAGKDIVSGRGVYCLNVGGLPIDEAVTQAFLEALEPAGVQAALIAAQPLEADHDAVLAQWQLAVVRAKLMKPTRPNAAIARSSPQTGWWPADSKPSGRSAYGNSIKLRPNWLAVNTSALPC
jgi:hypothetical protein